MAHGEKVLRCNEFLSSNEHKLPHGAARKIWMQMQSEPEDNRIDALIAKIANCKPGYFCIATSIAPIENIHATNKRAKSHSNQTPEIATIAAKSIHSQVFLEKIRAVASYRPMLADAHHTAASGGHASFSAAELHANGNSVGPEDCLPNAPMWQFLFCHGVPEQASTQVFC